MLPRFSGQEWKPPLEDTVKMEDIYFLFFKLPFLFRLFTQRKIDGCMQNQSLEQHSGQEWKSQAEDTAKMEEILVRLPVPNAEKGLNWLRMPCMRG